MREFNDEDFKNAFRYLKMDIYSGEDFALAKKMYEILIANSRPKNIVRVCDATYQDGSYSLAELGLMLESKSLATNFKNVEKIAVTVSTLGAEVDKKIIYYSKIDILKATYLDALASVMIENVLDDLENELHKKYLSYSFSPRYSPGYGDLSLSLQRDIIESLSATKLVGISVNSSYLLTPMKSITSFIGLSKDKNQNYSATNICENCNLYGKCEIKCKNAKR